MADHDRILWIITPARHQAFVKFKWGKDVNCSFPGTR